MTPRQVFAAEWPTHHGPCVAGRAKGQWKAVAVDMGMAASRCPGRVPGFPGRQAG